MGPLDEPAAARSPAQSPVMATDTRDPQKRRHFPLDFVRDYMEHVTEAQRMKRMSVSFYGYIFYLVVIFLLYFMAVEPSQTYDLETIGLKIARVEDDAWGKMENLEDFWNWVQNKMMPEFYNQYWYTMKDSSGANYNGGSRAFETSDTLGNVMIYRHNLIVGALRIQQKRVKMDACSIPSDSYRSGDHCYPYLDSDNEDTASFTGPAGTTYSFVDDSTSSEWWGSIPGQFATYKPGGYNADFAPGLTLSDWTLQLNQLKDNIWLGYPTRMVSFTINTYNAGLNMWSHTMFLFEFSASGAIYKKVQSRTFTMKYSANEDLTDHTRNFLFAFTFWLSIHYFINAFVFVVMDIKRYLRFEAWCDEAGGKEEAGCCQKFLRVLKGMSMYLSAWRVLDIITSAFIFAWLGLRFVVIGKKNDFNPDMATTSFVEDTASIASMIAASNQLMGLIMWLMLLKSFKFMEMNKNLAVIWNALVLCVDMLAYFTVAFFIIFAGFAFWGHVTFGSDLAAFATPVQSLNTCVDMLIGNGDLASLYAANRVMGPIFYFFYTIVMTLILVNVFIAIICEAYTAARDDAQVPPPFEEEKQTLQEQAEIASSGFRSYARKLLMFFTFNLCFTSPVGLPIPADMRWELVALPDRIKLVLLSQLCYLFNFFFLFRFTNSGDEQHSRVHQIYENAVIIRLCFDKIAGEDDHCAVERGPITLMFGVISDVEQMLERWQGPKDGRFADGTLDKTLHDCITELATEMEMLKEMVMSQQGIAVGQEALKYADRPPKLLTDWRTQEYGFIAGAGDFPIEMISLDVTTLEKLKMPVPDEEKAAEQDPEEPTEKAT